MTIATHAEQSFELKGVLPGGCQERYRFTPRGEQVLVEFFFQATEPISGRLLPLTRAREVYAAYLRNGFQRLAEAPTKEISTDKITQLLTDAGCKFACRRISASKVEIKVAATPTIDETSAEYRRIYGALKAARFRIVGSLAIGFVVVCREERIAA